jgi:hypothetical protein
LGIRFGGFQQHGAARRWPKQLAAVTREHLDEDMSVGRVHEGALRVVAESLIADETPGTKQCVASF